MNKSTDDLLKALSKTDKIESYIQENTINMTDISISKYLDRLLKQKDLSKSKVIKKAELNDTYAYQIFSGLKNNPSRDWIISIAFGMELTFEETQQMLKSIGLPFLYAKHKRDCIIIFSINNKYTVAEVNELLYDQGEQTLCQEK